MKKPVRTSYGAIRTSAHDNDLPAIEVSDTEDDNTPPEVQAMLNALSESGEFTLTINKYNEEKAVWEIVKKMPLDQFNEEQISTRYGGGQYKYVVRKPDGTFAQQIRANYASPVDERGALVAVPQIDNGQKDMVLMLQKELDNSRAKEQNLYSSMFAMMTELIKTQAAPKPVDNNTNFIDTYVKLRALDGKNPAAEITSVIDLIKTGMNMGKEIGVASSDSSPEDIIVKKLIDVAGNSLPNIIAALAKAQENRQPVVPAATVAPAAAPQNAFITPLIPSINYTPPAEPVEPERRTIMYKDEFERGVIENIRAAKKDLLFAAAANVDKSLVVNSILSKLDAKSLGDLFDYFSDNPDSESRNISAEQFERVLVFIPELRQHGDWLRDVLKFVMAEITFEQAEPKKEEPPAGGEK